MLMEGLKMDDLMEAEGLRESDVWGIGEIEEIEPILPMELSAEVPGWTGRWSAEIRSVSERSWIISRALTIPMERPGHAA